MTEIYLDFSYWDMSLDDEFDQNDKVYGNKERWPYFGVKLSCVCLIE